MTQKKEIKFYIEYDKSYSHSFASGVEISSVGKGRLDLTFHYEKSHMPEEISTAITDDGKVQLPYTSSGLNDDILEIDRIIKTSVSLDNATVKSLIDLLEKHLEK